MLRFGGTNRGGPGRPRDEVRQAALDAYGSRIRALEAIADRSAADYVLTRAGLVAVPAKLDTVIRAMSELRACAGLVQIDERKQPKKQILKVVMVHE